MEYRLTWAPRSSSSASIQVASVEIPGLLHEVRLMADIPYAGSWHANLVHTSGDMSILNGYLTGGEYPSIANVGFKAVEGNTNKFTSKCMSMVVLYYY